MKPIQAWIRALDLTKKSQGQTLHSLLDGLAELHGPRIALLDGENRFTYVQMRDRINRYARWAIMKDLPGHTVGLLLHNCPDYFMIWLGLTRAGCTVALLNTGLKADAIASALDVAEATALIASADLSKGLDRDPRKRFIWPLIYSEMLQLRPGPLTQTSFPEPDDVALLIYTSGTTGLPKAVRITHARIVEWSFWFAGMTNATEDDRLYNCLPMYHSVGGIVAIGSMLVAGGSVVIRQRFSVRRFWDDVIEHQCSIFQYIGELCRYLTLVSPSQPNERQHKLRLAVGNGLQKQVWEQFQERFGIPQILEFYAATESGVSLYNVEGRPGAIGRVPAWTSAAFPVAIIRCDPETGEPIRNADNTCQACLPDEVGEAIGRIGNARRFDGYTDRDASAKKILQDVFAPGDAWFRTGDLMCRDQSGYYYFVDRIGDTYRWKGENVSTTAVESVLCGCTGVIEAVVYGVVVPGQEGRAGMAALLTDDAFDFSRFYAEITDRLPEYQRPVFVRLLDQMSVTGTFKYSKTDLRREGCEGGGDRVRTYHLTDGYL